VKTCVETGGEFGLFGRIKPSSMNREIVEILSVAMTPPNVDKQKRHYNAVKPSSELSLKTHRSASSEPASDELLNANQRLANLLGLIHRRRLLGWNTASAIL